MERTPEDYANKDYDDLWQENENKLEMEILKDWAEDKEEEL